ncbi:MAG: enoyl-CoA hydratase-related protein, partial [Alphaproteobacteria bacterium]|nr:enoyl-CoA hydratase-related protein [Alphaproteobacteria bacterium]
MAKVLYEKDGRIGRITLNRPEVMNAIDDDLPVELAAAVAAADADPDVHVMVLSGNGRAFSAGYDLAHYAEGDSTNQVTQECPSSKHSGLLSLFFTGGSGSSWFDVKPLVVDGSSGV